MRSLLFGACSAAALCAGMPAHAQIGDVIITGYLEEELPQELARYGARVETVTAEEILNGGYVDAASALQNQVPGLYIAPLSGPFDYVDASYQGSRVTELLWLVDGVRMNNRLYSTTPPTDTIPAHMIERIEVIEAGQALFYGTTAVAGAINIVTKEFSDTPDGAISLGAGSFGERHINGYFRDSIGPHQFVIYGSSDQADGFRPFRKADYQPSATDRERGYDAVSLGIKYGVNIGEDARFSVSYQHTDTTNDYIRPFLIAEGHNDRDEEVLSAKLDWTVSDQIQLFIKGYYHDWDTAFTEVDNVIGSPGTLDVVSDGDFWGFEDYGLNALAKYAPGGGFEFYAGYDYQTYSGEDQVFLIAPQNESVHAPFAQIRTTDDLIPNVVLSAGVRHNIPSDAESSTVWNVSGRWDITPNLFARATGGTAFRLPDAYELYVVDPCCEQGNPNLDPERSYNINGSVGGTVPMGSVTLTWEAVGYLRNIEDMIEIVFDPDLGVDTFANSGPTVKVRGGELIVGAEFDNVFSANLSYSFNSSETEGTNVQRPDVPESMFKAILDYHPMDLPFGASVTVNHIGDVYRSALGIQQYGDYTVVDVGARVFIDPERRHRIGVKVQNLFDEEYATRVRVGETDGGADYVYRFRGMPQSFYLNYTYQFGM